VSAIDLTDGSSPGAPGSSVCWCSRAQLDRAHRGAVEIGHFSPPAVGAVVTGTLVLLGEVCSMRAVMSIGWVGSESPPADSILFMRSFPFHEVLPVLPATRLFRSWRGRITRTG
jgi:hypothetical protein